MQKDRKPISLFPMDRPGTTESFSATSKDFAVFRHLHHHHAIIKHVLDFLLGPESKLRHLRENLPIVDGG